MKRNLSLIIAILIICLNSVFVIANAEDSVTAKEFASLVQQFASDYAPGGIASGDISSRPLNRLIIKTDSDEPLENYYGARDKLEGYGGIHILQYATSAQTSAALSSFIESGITDVAYDVWVGIESGEFKYCYCCENAENKNSCYCRENEFGLCDCEDKEAPENHLSWNSKNSRVEEAFELIESSGITCKPITVAVFDTGLESQHEYFDPSRIENADGYSLIVDDVVYDSNKDGHYHGTHVAGIVYDNTMSNVKISSYRVYGDSCEWIPYSVYWAAFKAAIANEVDVINISSIQLKFTSKEEEAFKPGTTFEDLMNEAVENNIVIVSAAGNSGRAVKDKEIPASFKAGITVSATGRDDIPEEWYSNYGDCVDVAAPGTDIYSTVPTISAKEDLDKNPIYVSYLRDSGTSMAAPLVSAAAATLKSIVPDITPAEVERIIKETAYVPENWDAKYGAGIINFYNMVKSIVEPEISTQPQISVNADNKFEITAPEGARIYYTLDSKVPTINEHLTYSEPINLRNVYAEKITAVCHENGKLIGEPIVYDLVETKEKTIFYKWSYKFSGDEKTENARWQSYNPDIAFVDENGEITGASVGTTKITCRLPTGERIVWNVTVKYSPLQMILVIIFFGFLWL